MKNWKVGIIGATGYGGAELIRILYNHKNAELVALSSVSFEGKNMSDVYASFLQNCGGYIKPMTLESEEAVIEKSDIIFAALPHGLSEPIAAACLAKGKRFIDLGADFRLEEEETYKAWYKKPFDKPEIHGEAIYALPELNRESIKGKSIIANPGCYPTSAALGLFPALKNCLIEKDGIIIDAKSGVTGAGRKLSETGHFANLNEGFAPYNIGGHRHIPEIEQTLSDIAGKPISITFVPHLLPINRGILSTIYTKLRPGVTLEQVYKAYEKAYSGETFIRLSTAPVNVKNVKYSNFCDISLHEDKRTNTLVIVSAIDNMVKGAAGQAVQNMNILCGLPEETGLLLIPPAF